MLQVDRRGPQQPLGPRVAVAAEHHQCGVAERDGEPRRQVAPPVPAQVADRDAPAAGHGHPRGAVLLDQAVADVDVARHAGHQLLVVRREEEGDLPLLVQLDHQVEDPRRRLGVEVGGRLVGEHEDRARDERAGDGHALALPARELVRRVAGEVGEPDVGERLRDALAPLRDGELLVDEERQLDVLLHVEDRHQVEGLEDEADPAVAQPAPVVVGERRDVHPLDADLRRCRARRCSRRG